LKVPEDKEIDKEQQHNMFNLQKIDDDIKILQDNMQLYAPIGDQAKVVIFFSLIVMFYVSWMFTLMLLAGINSLVIFNMCYEMRANEMLKEQAKIKHELYEFEKKTMNLNGNEFNKSTKKFDAINN